MNKNKILSQVHPLILEGICHRGLHNEKDIENGMNAFRNALNAHMAFELDVHLSKDGKLVVCHDSDLTRVTGKPGIIEHLTYEEIRDAYPLKDGEIIPLLSDVFELVQEKVPIVLELKVYEKNYKELAEAVSEALKAIQNKQSVLLISFDPRSLFPFKGSGFLRELLVSTEYRRTWFFRHFFEGVDLDWRFMNEKRFRRYNHRHFVNVWTIDQKEKLDAVLPCADTVTFQFMGPESIRDALKNR